MGKKDKETKNQRNISSGLLSEQYVKKMKSVYVPVWIDHALTGNGQYLSRNNEDSAKVSALTQSNKSN